MSFEDYKRKVLDKEKLLDELEYEQSNLFNKLLKSKKDEQRIIQLESKINKLRIELRKLLGISRGDLLTTKSFFTMIDKIFDEKLKDRGD